MLSVVDMQQEHILSEEAGEYQSIPSKLIRDLSKPPWRNWLARSAVNRKVGGSSPPGGDHFLFCFELNKLEQNWWVKSFDPGRTRTCNPLIRSQMPYPLGHRASWII